MRYGNKFLATITFLSGTVFAGLTSQTAIAQQYYEPDGNYPGHFTPDANAQHNNEIYGVEQRRARQYRRQLRRERRARQRARARAQARARAKRQRLYDVRQRESDKFNQGGYDYYGNPVPRKARPAHKTRERVKLVYVPLPREKPYRQPVVKVATTPAGPTVFVPTPEAAPKKTVGQKAVKIATLPKIEIETLPNPSAPKVFTPTAPKVVVPKVVAPKVTVPTPPVAKKPIDATPVVPATKTPEKKIKYTTFADTLRKIRERNAATKRQAEKVAIQNTPQRKTVENKAPEVKKPKVEKPLVANPIVKPTVQPVVKAPVINKPIAKNVEIKKPEIKKIAALTPKVVAPPTPPKNTVDPRPAANQISCVKAKKIIVDYGFSDVSKITCKGKSYDFKAKRDGKAFKITLSSLSGELTKVLRQK